MLYLSHRWLGNDQREMGCDAMKEQTTDGYQIFTDATADLSAEMTAGLPHVEVIPMQVEIGENEYTYGPGGDIDPAAFYALQRSGQQAMTSSINPATYFEVFEKCLRSGKDVLYLCFSSGLSSTFQSAQLCMQELKQEYPQRKLLCIDTLCASAGEGFLVREAARKQDEGLSFDELAAWARENRLNVCHCFTVDTFEYLKHGGRVDALSAAVGTMLHVKPMLHVDGTGNLAVIDRPRGRRHAIEAQLNRLEQGWLPEKGRTVLVAHGDCPDGAEQLREEIAERFPDAALCTTEIGPVIGAHTGPGMLAVLYWGSNR